MQQLAKDYVNQLNNLNQSHFIAFRDAFITKFNKENLVSKVVTTNKISLADNKKQKAASYGVSIATDILGMFVPTGTLGKVVDDVIGSVFQGHRKKGYQKLDGISPHTTKTELLAQALANGLQLYYKQDLCSKKTKKAEKRGSKAAERVARLIKKAELTSTDMTLKDWLNQMLSYMISFNHVKEDMKDSDEVDELTAAFKPEELDALLLISSSQLLGLSADFLLKVLKNEEDLATYKAENSEQVAELNAEVNKIFEQVESNTSRLDELEKQQAQPTLTVNYHRGGKNVTVGGNLNSTVTINKDFDMELPAGATKEDVNNLIALSKAKNEQAQREAKNNDGTTTVINVAPLPSDMKIGQNLNEKFVQHDKGVLRVTPLPAKSKADESKRQPSDSTSSNEEENTKSNSQQGSALHPQ